MLSITCLITSVLAFVCFHTTSVAADNLVVQSERLRNFQGCSALQQKQITEAWNEAMKIAHLVKNDIKFSWRGEREFFGEEKNSKLAQDDIRALISQAATYDLAGEHSPIPSWEVNITCVDWKDRCNKGKRVMAYTTNPEGRDGEKGNFMDTIAFCPDGPFLAPNTRIESCAALIAKWEKSRYIESGHLENYQCWGYVVLHELFHLNSLSRVSSRGHVYDRWVEFYERGDPKENKQKALAYGPAYTKILATYNSITAGILAATNADSLARFCLARYVERVAWRKLYPKLPEITQQATDSGYGVLVTFADDGTLILNTTELNAHLPYPATILAIEDDHCDEGSDTTGCISSIKAPEILPTCDPNSSSKECIDSLAANRPISFSNTNTTILYPDPPINLDRESPEPELTEIAPYKLPDDPYFTCYRGLKMEVKSQPFVPQPFAQDKINLFCDQIAGIPLSSIATKTITMPYSPDYSTTILMWLSANWQLGDPSCANRERAPSVEECKDKLGSDLNNCDTDSIQKKYGGSNIVDCVDWTMSVMDENPPPPDTPTCKYWVETSVCECEYSDRKDIFPKDPLGGCSLIDH